MIKKSFCYDVDFHNDALGDEHTIIFSSNEIINGEKKLIEFGLMSLCISNAKELDCIIDDLNIIIDAVINYRNNIYGKKP